MKQLKQYLWAIPFVSFLGGYYLMSTLYISKTMSTPSVVGMDFIHAVRLLSDHQLNVRILAEKEDADLPPGTIISQNPQADTPIKAQQSIFLVISQHPQHVVTPHVMGRTEPEIIALIGKHPIKYKIYTMESNYPADTCFAQWPSPGMPLDKQQLIIYIAKDPCKPILMPNLVGRALPEVADFLTSHDMVPHLIHHPPVPDGHICSSACIVTDQRPMAGSLVAREAGKQQHIHLQVEER